MQVHDVCLYEELSYTISIYCINSNESDVAYTGSLKVNDAQDGQMGNIVEKKVFNIFWCIKSVSYFQVDLTISNSVGDTILSTRSKSHSLNKNAWYISTRYSILNKKLQGISMDIDFMSLMHSY